MNQSVAQDVRREKVSIPEGMSTREVSEKYGLGMSTAYACKKKDSS